MTNLARNPRSPHMIGRTGCLASWLACVLAVGGQAETVGSVRCPGGDFAFVLERDPATQALGYAVALPSGESVVHGSLGVETAGVGVVGDKGVTSKTDERKVDDKWHNPLGERSEVIDRFNEATFSIKSPDPKVPAMKLQVRAYDEGVAWRYILTGDGVWVSDRTTFVLGAKTRVWTSARAQSPISMQPLESVKGAVDRPVLAEVDLKWFLALGEAGLVDAARMKFVRSGADTLAVALDGKVEYRGALTTPWRVVRIAGSPAELLAGNDLALNLNDPPTGDFSWVKPGKVIREMTLTTAGARACVDFAASHGLQYILFDAGWYGPENNPKSDASRVNLDPARSRGPLDLRQVIGYARQKGIGVILYVNQIALTRQIDRILPIYQEWGVAGIKFGFVKVGPQADTRWLHQAVAKCAAHRLMVDIHDEYRPTGVSRTWPNLLTQEGIRGDEESPGNAAVLDTVFTRCLAGAGDQTNCYFAPRVPKMGSHGSQLAKSVLVFSPWQFLFWYDRPQGEAGALSVIAEVPELDFFRRLPTVWDETRWLDGFPGTHALVARRKGEVWFIAALTGNAPRDFKVPLGFLTQGRTYRMDVFSDDPSAATPTKVGIETSRVNREGVLAKSLDRGRGFAAILSPAG